MGKLDEKRKVKLLVLKQIKKDKDVLFGKFSSTLNRPMKAQKWQEITNLAISLGAVDCSRDVRYIRDVWWPNVRKSSMEKVENSKKTDVVDGKDIVLSAIDHEVLSIVKEESPSIGGLNIGLPESVEQILDGIEMNHFEDEEMKYLKKECLRVQLYKLKLEARKLEVELGMPPSEVTFEIETNLADNEVVPFAAD